MVPLINYQNNSFFMNPIRFNHIIQFGFRLINTIIVYYLILKQYYYYVTYYLRLYP